MLARVLLHVVEAARPVDVALNLGAYGERLLNRMPDDSGFIFVHLLHRDFGVRSGSRHSSEQTRVKGLTSAGGVEGGAIER